MAKGVEDTAFYRYGRLLALNDVGGDPSRFSVSVDDFHAANAARPVHNLLITQTHDTKRSGDVRARIGALAGMAEDWAGHVRRWFEACSPLRGPDAVERYFIFQTLIGAWPIEVGRVEAYIEKALREAKRNTNWIEPDTAYEDRVKAFCRRLYEHRPFLTDFEPFAAKVARVGDRAALGQLLLKLTVPGVPDIYQGDELLALALVDPDNRRSVDWMRRRAVLAEVAGGAAPTGETRKLWLITHALALRAASPEAFTGSYEPLDVGPDACAFVRGGTVLAATALRADVPDITVDLPVGTWRDVLHERNLGGRLPLADLLGEHGVALLTRSG
jgi:(1->4)-alpha-D-glucan 1-alpha-D-glucosylmutase